MLILLNRQAVLVEMMELCCFKIAEALKFEPHLVAGSWGLENDLLVPKFDVAYPETLGVTGKDVEFVIKTIFQSLKEEFFYRLKHIEGRHRDAEKEFEEKEFEEKV